MGDSRKTVSLLMCMEAHKYFDIREDGITMNERGVILDMLMDCKADIEYRERRLEEVGNSNRTIRKNLQNGIANTRTRMETIVEIAYALGIISEEESRTWNSML